MAVNSLRLFGVWAHGECCSPLQGEVDEAIAELEGLRKAAEADEVAGLKLKKQATAMQIKLKQTR